MSVSDDILKRAADSGDYPLGAVVVKD